ncbi:MAG: phosphoribosyl-AMP cyclohydrolase [Pseudomonadales bacterium]|nr:phosphoribosyl-AMP cyclohydrolase [Pseudomonadales bacterium]
MSDEWLNDIHFDDQGLVPAIAQDADSGRVLMVGWMNREAATETVRTGKATYYSRSRARLWRKGEESGHVQQVREVQLDCDGDVLILKVSQAGGIACHTGRASCFYRSLENDRWVDKEPVLKDPKEIYGHE